MAPEDQFDAKMAFFSMSLCAHLARIIDKAGLLDEPTRQLIHLNLQILEKAAALVDDDDTSAEMVDLLASILPPRAAR